jgi:hypothetical protein
MSLLSKLRHQSTLILTSNACTPLSSRRRDIQREREERESGERAKITAMKVPRQCPLVLLVKVGWGGGKAFDCEEGVDESWRKDRS